MNVYIGKERLPSAYQEVEYIESSGGECINTGYIPVANVRVKMIAYAISNSDRDYEAMFGTRNNSFRNNAFVFFMRFRGNPPCYNRSGAETTGSNMIYDQRIDIDAYGNRCSWTNGINTYSITTTGTVDNCVNSLLLFNLNTYNGSGGFLPDTSPAKMRLKRCEIYSDYNNSNSLVRNFIPCYRKSDNVVGMYDLVNNQFYTNAGTGTFSKGNDVTIAELKNAYIGEYVPFTPGANTICYFPLVDNQTDASGRGLYFNTTGTKKTIGYEFTGRTEITGGGSSDYFNFVSAWCQLTNYASTLDTPTLNQNVGGFRYVWTPDKKFSFVNSSSSFVTGPSTALSTTTNTWYHFAFGFNSAHTQYKARLNGNLVWSGSATPKIYGGGNSAVLPNSGCKMILSDYIAESKLWTDDQVSTYYNDTKSNYGL